MKKGLGYKIVERISYKNLIELVNNKKKEQINKTRHTFRFSSI